MSKLFTLLSVLKISSKHSVVFFLHSEIIESSLYLVWVLMFIGLSYQRFALMLLYHLHGTDFCFQGCILNIAESKFLLKHCDSTVPSWKIIQAFLTQWTCINILSTLLILNTCVRSLTSSGEL